MKLLKLASAFALILFLCSSACAVSNVQHSVSGNMTTITYEGTPPFQVQIRRDREIGTSGGFVWAKTNNKRFSIDLGFAENPNRTFYYAVKDSEWSETKSFYTGQYSSSLPTLGCPSVEIPKETIFFEESGEILHNPHMGWAVTIVPDYNIYQKNPLPDPPMDFDVANIAVGWDYLEPEEGNYNWKKLDKMIAEEIARGRSIGIRLLMIHDKTWKTDIPQWVWDSGVPFQQDLKSTMRHPVYYNELYQEKLSNFLNAFAAQYNGKGIDYVTVMPYVKSGEWDADFPPLFEWPDEETKKTTLARLIEIYDNAFESTDIDLQINFAGYFDREYESIMQRSALDTAMDKGFGIAFHGFKYGNYVPYYIQKAIGDFAATSFVNGESHTSWDFSRHKIGGTTYSEEEFTRRAHFMLDRVIEARTNSVSFAFGSRWPQVYEAFLDDSQELYEKGLKNLGYRFFISEIEIPESIVTCGNFGIRTEWKNRARGRLYKPYSLCVFLEDETGKIAWSKADKTFDPRNVLSNDIYGETYSVESEFSAPAGIKEGTYLLKIGLINPKSMTNPDNSCEFVFTSQFRPIELDINAQKDSNNLYSMGTVEIKNKT